MSFNVSDFLNANNSPYAVGIQGADLALAGSVIQAQGIKSAGIANAMGIRTQALGVQSQAAGLTGQANQLTLAAQGSRLAGDSALEAANYNINLLNYQTSVSIDTMSRQSNSLLSTQKAQAASSGFGVGSRSFLSVMSDTLDQTTRNIGYTLQDTKNRNAATLYEGQVTKATQYLQATQQEYGATISNFQAGILGQQADYMNQQANFVQQSAANQAAALTSLASQNRDLQIRKTLLGF